MLSTHSLIMSLRDDVEKLLERLDPNNEHTYESAIQESGINVIGVKTDAELVEKLLPDDGYRVLITDEYLEKKFINPLKSQYSDKFQNVSIYTIVNEDIKEVQKIIEKMDSVYNEVIGVGGGRTLDVAKMVAKEKNLNLKNVPTTPSHDGIVSGTSSLIENGKKKTFSSKFPSTLIYPWHIMRNAPTHLQNSGKCDILAKFTALEDLSLASARNKDTDIEQKRVVYSLRAIKTLLDGSGIESLIKSLFLASRAMEETSKYGSGSEHDLEKSLELKNPHGQLVGLGSLISAWFYKEYANYLPRDKLYFNPEKLYPGLVKILRSIGLYGFIKESVKNAGSGLETWLNEASDIRPERYSILNEVNTREVDWDKMFQELSIFDIIYGQIQPK